MIFKTLLLVMAVAYNFLPSISLRLRYQKINSIEIKYLSQSLQATSDIAELSQTVQPGISAPVIPDAEDPNAQYYILCSACKAAYLADQTIRKKGCKVKCCVCEKEWFQSPERILRTDDLNSLRNMTEAKVEDIKRSISNNNWPRGPKVDRVDVFVGNLPYAFEEKDLSE